MYPMPIKCDQGCFLGQLVGYALDSLIEFQLLEEFCLNYPNGVRAGRRRHLEHHRRAVYG